jgi:DNA-binding LytR/AlgR family response regulator
MIYTYCIIEDNPAAVKSLNMFMNQFSNYQNIGVSASAGAALTMIAEKKPHLIFLDVELETGTGLEVLQNLKSIYNYKPLIIMITDHEQYAIDAVNKDVLYFLSKPFDPDELYIGLQKFENRITNQSTHFKAKTNDGFIRIPFDSITLFMSDRNYVHVFIKNGEKHLLSISFSALNNELPSQFIRVHKSFIVNKKLIEMYSFTKKNVILSCDCLFNDLKKIIIERENNKINSKRNIMITEKYQPKESYKVSLPLGKSYFDNLKKNF